MYTNRTQGTKFEAKFCEMLFEEGFWVHNFAQNSSGQPADVIAVKNGKAYLIDCKVCEKDEFPFHRIEPNQHLSMKMWCRCGNAQAWFALKMKDGSVWMMSYPLLQSLSIGASSANLSIIKFYGAEFGKWVKNL